jgi:hypothetical protein
MKVEGKDFHFGTAAMRAGIDGPVRGDLSDLKRFRFQIGIWAGRMRVEPASNQQ